MQFSRQLLMRCLLVVLVMLVAGCASKYPQVTSDQLQSAQDFDYIIGPGDELNIFVWGNEELTVSVPVRPDGKITTRLVEDIQASGKTPTQLARDVEKAYSEYVKNAVVTVIVDEFVGVPNQQVRVIGEAAVPLTVPFRKHMTLLDLMIEVGGLTEFADGNKSVLIRNIDGEQQVYNVRLEDLVQDGDISANVALMPGDIMIIPEAWF
ncbi:XrtA/PEP-CTERM system exopolysaccharide export protein [Sedimenticola thiotaurini]|uniref:Sugar ABC transporter substrate-binding protein n=1 Tax=Sedimenticola thiotaurini TaxID=1543721 RepID=A0A0F7JVW7_9GAMM|nr:XrtA/PEP-CTERM system exopolysaccharide export protein [Sedimenticola thiotaurini]AKH19722.1 sugar ABC transporter substrate-binding protein [Sedimenticola thiotaurini]